MDATAAAADEWVRAFLCGTMSSVLPQSPSACLDQTITTSGELVSCKWLYNYNTSKSSWKETIWGVHQLFSRHAGEGKEDGAWEWHWRCNEFRDCKITFKNRPVVLRADLPAKHESHGQTILLLPIPADYRHRNRQVQVQWHTCGFAENKNEFAGFLSVIALWSLICSRFSWTGEEHGDEAISDKVIRAGE